VTRLLLLHTQREFGWYLAFLSGEAAAASVAPAKPPSPCLDHLKIPSFFTLSVTSIFSRLHGVLNIGKKNN
jgi:hypothetical protein